MKLIAFGLKTTYLQITLPMIGYQSIIIEIEASLVGLSLTMVFRKFDLDKQFDVKP